MSTLHAFVPSGMTQQSIVAGMEYECCSVCSYGPLDPRHPIIHPEPRLFNVQPTETYHSTLSECVEEYLEYRDDVRQFEVEEYSVIDNRTFLPSVLDFVESFENDLFSIREPEVDETWAERCVEVMNSPTAMNLAAVFLNYIAENINYHMVDEVEATWKIDVNVAPSGTRTWRAERAE